MLFIITCNSLNSFRPFVKDFASIDKKAKKCYDYAHRISSIYKGEKMVEKFRWMTTPAPRQEQRQKLAEAIGACEWKVALELAEDIYHKSTDARARAGSRADWKLPEPGDTMVYQLDRFNFQRADDQFKEDKKTWEDLQLKK